MSFLLTARPDEKASLELCYVGSGPASEAVRSSLSLPQSVSCVFLLHGTITATGEEDHIMRTSSCKSVVCSGRGRLRGEEIL